MIDMWLNFKNSQPCPNAPDKTVVQVLESRKQQNIDINLLDNLMLKTEVKTIQRNGIRFLNCDYYDERLYGFKSKVLIKYNLFDLTSIKVYTLKGEYLCTAERVTESHPMAKILGTVQDLEDYKQKIEKQKKLRRKTINSVKQILSNDEVKFIETKINDENNKLSNDIQKSFKRCLNGVQKMNTNNPIGFTNNKKYLPPFKNNAEKYEYLIQHEPNNSWITEFKNTKEYKLLYE